MKIRLVSTSSGSRGGGEFYMHSLATGLQRLDHDVTTLMSTHSQMDELADRFEESSLRVIRWPYQNTYHRRFRSIQAAFAKKEIRECVKILSREDPDLIHVNQQCVEDGLDLIQAVGQCGIPAVSTIHVTRSMSDLKALGGWFRDRTSKRVLLQNQIDLIGVSQTSAVDLARFINDSSELEHTASDSEMIDPGQARRTRRCPVYAVPNGVPTPEVKDRTQLRDSWGIPGGSVVLGCVARIQKQKNPLFVVPLMKNLPSHVHFVWIGDGREMNSLLAAIQAEGLGDRFHLKGWQAEASAQLSGFDIFVLPSFYEGLPLALLEAMALGVPAVASDVDGMRDAIINGQSGCLCPVNDISNWTSIVLSLIESTELRAKVGEAARLKHRNEFSLTAMAERTVAVYNDVISKHTEKLNDQSS